MWYAICLHLTAELMLSPCSLLASRLEPSYPLDHVLSHSLITGHLSMESLGLYGCKAPGPSFAVDMLRLGCFSQNQPPHFSLMQTECVPSASFSLPLCSCSADLAMALAPELFQSMDTVQSQRLEQAAREPARSLSQQHSTGQAWMGAGSVPFLRARSCSLTREK